MVDTKVLCITLRIVLKWMKIAVSLLEWAIGQICSDEGDYPAELALENEKERPAVGD